MIRAQYGLEHMLWIGYATLVGVIAMVTSHILDDALLAAFPDSSYNWCGTCAFNHQVAMFIRGLLWSGVPLWLGVRALHTNHNVYRFFSLLLTLVFLAGFAWLTYRFLCNMQLYESTSRLIWLALWRAVAICDAALWLLLILLSDQRRLAGHSLAKDAEALYRSIIPRW